MDAHQRTTRARIAALRRHRPEAPETVELAAEFKTDRLAQYIARIVDTAPPLSSEQRDRLALLLRGAGVAS